MSAVRVGDVLAGRFRVERLLGEGGMGVVLLAHHMSLDQNVAIKLVSSRLHIGGDTLTRFIREAQAASKIKSEHVVRIFDVAQSEDGSPYIVMEYLEGHDLQRELESRGAMPVADAVDIILQACVALAEAHKIGIVHRDLKPGNLFLTHRADGSRLVKILDFGISKFPTRSGSLPDDRMTRTTSVLGSPLYMSPEQTKSARDVTEAADVWSLGIILYQLLTGLFPFPGNTVAHIAVNIAEEPPIPFAGRAPGLTKELEAVVVRCLEKDPRGRFPNVGAFAEALKPFAGPTSLAYVDRARGVLAAPARPSEPPAPPAQRDGLLGTIASFARTRAGSRAVRASLLAAMIAGASIGIVVFVLFVIPAMQTPPRTATAPATATATATTTTTATASGSGSGSAPATASASATASVPTPTIELPADTPRAATTIKPKPTSNRPFGTDRR